MTKQDRIFIAAEAANDERAIPKLKLTSCETGKVFQSYATWPNNQITFSPLRCDSKPTGRMGLYFPAGPTG